MKKSTISDLECPSIINGNKCRGNLSLKVRQENHPEVLFGSLTCDECSQSYPIIQGIPVLMNNLQDFMKANFARIKKILGEEDKTNQSVYRLTLTVSDAVFEKNRSVEMGPEKITGEGENYFAAHYGDFEGLKHSDLMSQILELHAEKSALRIISEWIIGSNKGEGKAIDIGCNVGGFSKIISEKCGFVYGVDLSFENLFKASRVIKHLPSQLDNYKVRENGGMTEKKLCVKKRGNVDFVLASADNLPFKDCIFGNVLMSSVLDISRNNHRALKEAERMLSEKGRILLSFVPFFRKLKEGQKEVDLTGENIKASVERINFYKEIDKVPFILRRSEYHYSVYDNYCMMGTAL